MIGQEIQQLIELLARLPGLGPRSARRIFLELIKKREKLFLPLRDAFTVAIETIKTCDICGNMDVISPCTLCNDPKRDASLLCIVQDVADLWALERTKSFKGRYHVLGGTLSALDGVGPNDLNIPNLIERTENPEIQEIILAMNATIDGQTTAHYIMELLGENKKVTHLAHGIPIGGELDYLDDGTLTMALNDRRAS
jgi:recombination protein RecR